MATDVTMTERITMTERAAQQIQRVLSKRGQGEGIRLGVRKSGCSGYAYKLDYVDTPQEDDFVCEAHGAKLFVSSEALKFVDGTQVDYVTDGLQSTFRFENPNVQSECGCGESFNVE